MMRDKSSTKVIGFDRAIESKSKLSNRDKEQLFGYIIDNGNTDSNQVDIEQEATCCGIGRLGAT